MSFSQIKGIEIINGSYISKVLTLLPLDNDSLTSLYNNTPKNSPYTFAEIRKTDIKTNKNGTWIINNDSSYSWILGIKSGNAYSISLLIENILIPNDAKLFIINRKNKNVIGPYSHKNITDEKQLFTEPISGDEVFLELDVPKNTDTTQSYLTIVGIGHDFRDFYNKTEKKRGLSGSCEMDINCSVGNDWQKEKRAIVKYTYPVSGKISSCTGTLVNNTATNELPYILTANHCIKDDKTASLAIFYFNYENSDCGLSDASTAHSISGAKLIATSKDSSAKLDFSLLLLKQAIPLEYKPYYAAWTLNKGIENNVTTIHHPKGDPMKISVENDLIKNGNFTDNNYMANSHWQVMQWDTGATEKGSSGCALFNSNHQIIGTLSGGDATCLNPVNDFFQKFYKSWDYFKDSIYQLKYWLNPIDLVVSECKPYDPQVGNANPVTNIQLNEELKIFTFGAKAKGTWTGFNEPGFKFCAEQFTGIKNEYIYAIKFPISIKNTNTLQNIKLIVWNGLDQPNEILYEHYLSADSIINNKYYCLRLPTFIKVGQNYFVGFNISNVSQSDSIDFFTVADRSNKSSSLFYYYKNKWIPSIELGYNTSLGVEVYVTNSSTKYRPINRIPEKLLSINYKTKDSLQTRELFSIDSVCNYDEKGILKIHKLLNKKGIWSGTNDYDMMMFAEKYTIPYNSYISAIKLAVAKKFSAQKGSYINLHIMYGENTPDTIITTQQILLDSISENYFNVFKLPDFLKLDSSFFVVLDFSNMHSNDTLGLYMGSSLNSEFKTHSYFKTNDIWFNYYMYDIAEHLGLSVETVYSPYVFNKNDYTYKYKITNNILPPEVVFKSIFLYPNPSTKQGWINLNFGNYFTKDIDIKVLDIFGRIVSTPEIIFDELNNVRINTSHLSSGVYYVKVIIEDTELKAIPFINVR